MEDDLVEILGECRRAIDDTLDMLSELQERISGEDAVRPVALQQLHDMVEDAAESGRIRRAETNLAWRYSK